MRMKKVKFDVFGMTCSSCQTHVDKAVKKLEGVKTVNVNLLSNEMVVEFDENKLLDADIIKAVVDAGYNAEVKKKKENKKIDDALKNMKKRLIVSFIFLIPLMYIAMHQMLNEMFGIPVPEFIKNVFSGTENALNFAIAQIILLIPIVFLNRSYFIVGFKRLFKLSPNMDSLISLGSTASIVYGFVAITMMIKGFNSGDLNLVAKYSKDIYFESAGTILTLITLGKYLETKSKGRTSEAISKLINLAPKTATVIIDGKELEVKLEDIKYNDVLLIKPGESIPVDGLVIEGKTSIDQSSITGESIPVEKKFGDKVISGTINKNGSIKIRADKVGEDTTLSQIIKLVEEASNSKAPISKIADKVSGVFVPVVILISLLTLIIWLVLGQTAEFAITCAIAVLVISCPCALGLATPVAIMVGTGKGAENGILIKDAESLEMLHNIDTVVLDKTGTITEGKPKVVDIITSQSTIGSNLKNVKVIRNKNNDLKVENELLKIAASLEKKSEHPLADAILEKAKERNIKLLDVTDFEAVSGRGIKAKIDGIEYFAGNIAFMNENGIDTSIVKVKSETLSNEGKTSLYFAKENTLIGVIAVADTLKPTSIDAIKSLQNQKLDVIMLTGDNKLTAEVIAGAIGIKKVISEVMPQDKEKEVSKLQKEGKKVAFVGDGINDSPALVRADVGIAIGSGTDIAIESADIVLMKDDLYDVDTAIRLSKATINNIKMNLFWAFFYNMIGIPVAAGVFYLSLGLKLNPMIGAAAMSFSSVCVVTNALRLRKFKGKNKVKQIENKNDNNYNCSSDKCNIENAEKTEKEEVYGESNKGDKENMKIIVINGMACNHCKMTVEKVLGAVEGVEKAEVNLEEKVAKVTFTKEVENDVLKSVVEEAGFEVVEIKE